MGVDNLYPIKLDILRILSISVMAILSQENKMGIHVR